MELTGSQRIPAIREIVWAGLNDPETLKACIPGCQSLEKISDRELKATVVSKIGPVKATFTGQVTLDNLNPPESYTIAGQGTGGAAGFAKGQADVSLAEDGAETVLTYSASAQVGGKIAQLGSRLVDGVARQTADAFFANFAREIVGREGAGKTDAEAVSAESPIAPPMADAPPLAPEQPHEGPAPVVEDAPPLAATGGVLPPAPASSETLPETVAADAAAAKPDAEGRTAVTAGSSNVSRILLIAAVVIAIGLVAYVTLWPQPA